ncbi:MAG: sigma-70 family RNA polymerase sigma factor [Planctomycetes bacterium]|nr:sigma-70 family RNA polymerase sigma factor [Planctomycetota bacterium]
MTESTRATLLERLRDGADPRAWDQFFESYWPAIYACARQRGCTDDSAQDIVQEVMLKVFEQRDVFRYDPSRGRFRDWLHTVVRNQIAECRRRPSARIRPAGAHPENTLPEPAAGGAAPDEAWERAFERGLLSVVLDVARREANPRDYLAFELLMLDDLSGNEASRLTGLSRNAAYKAARRVLTRLKALVGGYESDGKLTAALREALAALPEPPLERQMTTRVERTLRAR